MFFFFFFFFFNGSITEYLWRDAVSGRTLDMIVQMDVTSQASKHRLQPRARLEEGHQCMGRRS